MTERVCCQFLQRRSMRASQVVLSSPIVSLLGLSKDPESDGLRNLFQRLDQALVPLMIDVQDGVADRALGVVDLAVHVDAPICEHVG